MGKSKAGSFFKNFFKVIFTLVALASGAIALFSMFAPFITIDVVGSSLLNSSMMIGISGIALAFGGDLALETIIFGGEPEVQIIEDAVSMQTGVLVAFILLAVALLTSIIYLFFAWGKKGTFIKKFFGGVSGLTFIASGILFFLTLQLCGDMLKEEIPGIGTIDLSELMVLGPGAISSGIFAILAGASAFIATLLGPKDN